MCSIRTELGVGLVKLLGNDRTGIRTIGVEESQDHDLATKIAECHWLAELILKAKVRSRHRWGKQSTIERWRSVEIPTDPKDRDHGDNQNNSGSDEPL